MVGWDVRHETRQRLDPATNVGLLDDNGQPLTVDLTVLVLVVFGPDGHPHLTVEVPLDDDTRRELAARLNGGIVVPVVGLRGNGHTVGP